MIASPSIFSGPILGMLPRLPIPYPFYRPARPDAPRHDIWRSHDDKSLRVLADIAEQPGDFGGRF